MAATVAANEPKGNSENMVFRFGFFLPSSNFELKISNNSREAYEIQRFEIIVGKIEL